MFTVLKKVAIFLVIAISSPQAIAEPLKTTRTGKPTTSFVAHHKKIHSKGACLAKQANHRNHQSLDPIQTATKNFNSDVKRIATIIFHKYLKSFYSPSPYAAYIQLKTAIEVFRLLAYAESSQTYGRLRAVTHYLTNLIDKQFPHNFATLPPSARTNALALGHEILHHTIGNLLARNHSSFRDQYHFLATSFNTPELQAQKKLLHKKHTFACLMYGLLPSYKLENYIQKSIEKFITAHTAALNANNNGQHEEEEDEIESLLGQMGGLTLHDHFSEEKKQ